jgi:ElaB/YqjD/DUF883 family membrane-anchored ribosome-binding protein
MRLQLFIIILLSLSLSSTKCGRISNLIGDFFNDITTRASSGLIDNAKQAFRESMDYLFDNRILPLINQLEATADRVMDHARDDIDEVVDNFKKEIEELVDHAAKIAQNLIDHTIEEIKKNIIDHTFDRLNDFEEKVFQDITTILNKIDAILKEVSCYAQAIVIRVTEEIKKLLPRFINPFDHCRVRLGKLFPSEHMRFKSLSKFSPNQLYEFRKCKLISNLKDDSPMKAVKMAYRDLELLAGDMRCLSVSLGAVNNEKFYITEMGYADFILRTLDY